jgi:hypothetical protein
MMSNIERKLQEARYNLDKMREQEKRAFGGTERFDSYLSAFLNATRTVHYRLCYEHEQTYKTWRKTWNAAHPVEDNRIKFLSDNRRVEVHESGSTRIVQTEEIKVGPGSSYTDPSGTLEVWGTPATLSGGNAGATIHKPKYVFNIDGTDRPVTDVCAEGLEALNKMVADYKAHPTE